MRFHRQLDPLTLLQYPNWYYHLIENQTDLDGINCTKVGGLKNGQVYSLQLEYSKTTNNSTQVTQWSVGLGRLLLA